MEYKVTATNELYHHGIKGQKWGVRRYQNKDGLLTKAGKKHISKDYKKAQAKGDKELASNYNDLYVDAYNKTAKRMNNVAKKDGYKSDYKKEFNELLNKNLNKNVSKFIDNNANYQKAKSLVKQYNMLEWDSLAKENSEIYDEMHKSTSKGK